MSDVSKIRKKRQEKIFKYEENVVSLHENYH